MRLLKVLLASLLLVGCSNGAPTPPIFPSQGAWTNYANATTQSLPNSFSMNTLLGYVYTKPPQLKIGQTITLNYSINGNAVFKIVDPNDGPPASITLFIWENGDTLSSTTPGYQYYRWWCPTRAVLKSGNNQTLSCVIGNQWTDVVGVPVVNPAEQDPNSVAGFAKALSNTLGVGFTFGGANFYGHGVEVASGAATFTINSFTIQ